MYRATRQIREIVHKWGMSRVPACATARFWGRRPLRASVRGLLPYTGLLDFCPD